MRRHDLLIIGLLFLLPLLLFWPQTIGGRTLIPTENLYQFEPYATYREVVNAPALPHNMLVSDLVLQNYQWKSFIRAQFASGEIPLWNPHQFAGTPFMAAGQQSTLYPLSLIYYVMPLTSAYGWFTVVNLWLGGVLMFALMRGLHVSRFGATLSAITYQLAGMFVASAVHPMILGAVVWLPLLLLMAEFIITGRTLRGRPAALIWASVGALALALNVFAGHPEIMIYTLLIAGYFSAIRLLARWYTERGEAHALRRLIERGAALLLMVILGLALGAVQLVPLYEFVSTNWRAERSSFEAVLSYAHPLRDAVQYLVPNFYGSPSVHAYFDVFSGQMQPVDFVNAAGQRVTNLEWGIKNYVEAALYVGILPLVLAAFAVLHGWLDKTRRVYLFIFVTLILISASFMFGTPTYALIYGLPGINQLNTAFRWVFGVTVGVAVLAGFGADFLRARRGAARRWGGVLSALGVLILAALIVSRALYPQVEPLVESVRVGMAKAADVFPDARAFYSFQFVNVLILGAVTLGAGIALLWTRRGGALFAVILVAADLLIASWGFNPASDPLLLDFTPPAVAWLDSQAESGQAWRYAVVNSGADPDILRPNMTLRDGLDDLRGYDSIISKQYVDYMRAISPQNLLDHNQVAPLYQWDDLRAILTSPRFLRMNVRYLIAHPSVTFDASLIDTGFMQRVYSDAAVTIYAISDPVPRAYLLPLEDASITDAGAPLTPPLGVGTITRDSGRELFIDIDLTGDAWLIVSQSHAAGWKAYLRPAGAEQDQEREFAVERVQENFQGVRLTDLEAGAYTVRLVYSPTSFQVGVFGSAIGGAVLILLAGVWAWRAFVAPSHSGSSQTARLARNSLAPILLNLFNRGIDFVFAFVMFRILGPQDAGFYYYAIVVFGWFDIFTNFGLDVYLMREAGRARDDAPRLFYNTSALRLILVVAAIPALMAFLFFRQANADPLNADVLLTIGLFYLGLVPGSLSKGLTSLYYAFERAEYPAAVTTLTTISRVVLGVGALVLGFGIVGLGAVSLITNFVTLAVLFVGARVMLKGLRPQKPQVSLIRQMIGGSWPLMLNHFLATIFFQIDIVLLEWLKGARIVGLYRVAYSWLLAINVIPAFFTQALLPIMARQAQDDRAALRRTYTLAIKLLVAIAFPLAVGFTFVAEPLTWFLGGEAYLPEGAIALQIMIWSIPIGWMNSLTQYALVALNLQRRITLAFIGAVTFNITSNLIFIPQYSYQAAAITTILSELVLWIPFALLMQGALGRLNWLDILWRPALAAGATVLAMGVGVSLHPLIGIVAGAVVYPLALILLKPLGAEEWGMLALSLPARVRRLVGA